VPEKATTPEAHEGSVVAHLPETRLCEEVVKEWPRDKGEQELRVVQLFAVTLEAWRGRRLEDIRPLPQRDHDAVATEGGVRTEIQVTELVTRDALRDLGSGQVG
jgi:hypothetical protein